MCAITRWDPDFDRAARFVMSPPIRGAGTAARIRGALAGGALSIVATDHAVFNSTQKQAGRHDFRWVWESIIDWVPVSHGICPEGRRSCHA